MLLSGCLVWSFQVRENICASDPKPREALPTGIVSAYKQYSIFDQIGSFVLMVGFSVPTLFTGIVLIVIFSVQLQWLPWIRYD